MAGTTIDIDGNAKGFKKAAKDVNKNFKKISKGAQKSASKGTSAFKVFLGTFSAMGLKSAFGAALNGFRSLNKFVGKSIELSAQQEAAVNDLESALKRTGKFTQDASDDFQKFASSLQETSLFGDEVILKNAALIQSFGNLTNDGLKTATAAAVDLAAGIGVDLKTASNLLGRAASGNVGILSRYGLAIDSTGDSAKDFQLVLDKINESFGGAAAQQVGTYEGQTTQLANTFGDLQEVVGDTVTKNDSLVGVIGGLEETFKALGNIVKENQDELQKFIDGGVVIFIKSVGLASSSVGLLLDTMTGLNNLFQLSRLAINKVVEGFIFWGETIASVTSSIGGLLGINTDFADNAEQTLKEVRAAVSETSDGFINDALAFSQANENKKKAIASFANFTQEKLREGINAQKEANEQEVEAEKEKFEKLNEARVEQRAKEAELREAEKERKLNEQELERTKEFERLNYIKSILGEEEAFKIESRARELAAEGKHDAAKAKLREAQIKAEKNDMTKLRKWEDLSQKEKVANFKSTMGTIASLQSSSSAELFAIGKAAALAQATIDGFAAVQVALRSAPPPFNFALAAAVGAATAANISKIASQPKPKGAFNGALVEGGSSVRDTEPFMLSRGEIVAPRRSFDEVVEGTARQRGFVKGDGGEGKNINISIDTFIGQDEFINDVIDQIREKILFENADLGVS